MLRSAEKLAMRALPPKLVAQLQEWKQRLPLRLHLTAPVVQMYINDAHTRSFVGMNNFYSYLLPEIDTAAAVELRFYDPAGERVATHRTSLAHFAARAVDVSALGITAPHGIVTAQITPRSPRRRIYRELGQVSAHFFVFFRDREAGAVEQTHPLSTTDPALQPSELFTSSQIISTAKLRELVTFQYNPTPRTHRLEHSLADAETGKVVARAPFTLQSLGAARTVFAMAGLPRLPAQLLFRVDSLPASNAKPMLRRVFEGGRHSMSHA